MAKKKQTTSSQKKKGGGEQKKRSQSKKQESTKQKKEEDDNSRTDEGALGEVMSEIKQKFGEGAIMRLDQTKHIDVGAIPTGSFSLDLALGVNGVPRGRMIEIYGPESSGKSTLALHIVAEAQKQGGIGAFIDAEHALDPEYAERVGVQVSDLLISQPDSGEQALHILEALVRSGEVDVVVLDSVAALVPKAEVAGESGDFQVGLQARLMSQALRKLASIVSKSDTLIVFLNQTRMKVGVTFGSPETTSGGMALKFYSSVRIDLRRRAQLKQGDEVIGSRVKAKIVKNKVAPPFKTTEFDIYYKQGISYHSDLINMGLRDGVVKQKGSWLQYGTKQLGQGMENARQFLEENEDLAEQLKQDILASRQQTNQ